MSNLLQDLKIGLTFNVTIPASVWLAGEDDGNVIVFSNDDIHFDYDIIDDNIINDTATVSLGAVMYGYSTIDAVKENYRAGATIETNIEFDGVKAVINDIKMTDVIGLGI